MKTILLALLACAGIAGAATNYPFPYFADYPYGTSVRLSKMYSKADVQALYDAWKSSYYEPCSDGTRARIKWADPKASGGNCNSSGNCTVSEGIGYGMLIAVYMDNASNNTKPMFDKLWKYYNSSLDDKGLMNWKIDGCGSAVETGAATDAEMDVALALVMAYKQWGDAAYLTDAKSLLGKIWSSEVTSGKLLKPGSQFDTPYNPSYAAIGALRVFATVDPAHEWGTVADNLMTMLAANANSTTGLPSDWCSTSNPYGAIDFKGSGTTMFGYDAVRTPWRVALSQIWFGKAAERAWLSKINTWIKTKTNSTWNKTFADWKLDGSSSGNYTNSVYLGAFASTGFINTTDSSWFRKGAEMLLTKSADNYYNDSWQLIYTLTFVGNFQNLYGTVKPVGVQSRTEPAATWVLVRTGDHIELEGEGAVEAQLTDLRGRVLQSVSGTGSVSFDRPSARGVYFVHIPGAKTIPVAIGE